MVPIGLMLLFLTGVGPLIAWRKATASHLRYQFFWPGLAAAATIAVCLAAGLGEAPAGVICFGFCAFTLATIAQEFVRGVAHPQAQHRPGRVSSLMGMVMRGKRRYGGYLVHVGIVLMFIGFAGTAYQKERTSSWPRAAEAKIGEYTVRFDKLAHEEDRQKEMVTGELTALVDGKVIDQPAPGEVVLPQPRERADHRGRDPARPGRGPLHHARQLRPRRGARRRSSWWSTRWSTGSGSGSCCWRSATGIALLPTACSSG